MKPKNKIFKTVSMIISIFMILSLSAFALETENINYDENISNNNVLIVDGVFVADEYIPNKELEQKAKEKEALAENYVANKIAQDRASNASKIVHTKYINLY